MAEDYRPTYRDGALAGWERVETSPDDEAPFGCFWSIAVYIAILYGIYQGVIWLSNYLYNVIINWNTLEAPYSYIAVFYNYIPVAILLTLTIVVGVGSYLKKHKKQIFFTIIFTLIGPAIFTIIWFIISFLYSSIIGINLEDVPAPYKHIAIFYQEIIGIFIKLWMIIVELFDGMTAYLLLNMILTFYSLVLFVSSIIYILKLLLKIGKDLYFKQILIFGFLTPFFIGILWGVFLLIVSTVVNAG
jgi:hypothetical protein